jgi:hypothetical protein
MISYRTSSPRRDSFNCLMCFVLLGCIKLTAQVVTTPSDIALTPLLSNPPEARSPIDLTAINDANSGRAAFLFKRREDPPVIRAAPGEEIRITYVNAMSTVSNEKCIEDHA